MLRCICCRAEYEDREDGVNCPLCGSPGGKEVAPIADAVPSLDEEIAALEAAVTPKSKKTK